MSYQDWDHGTNKNGDTLRKFGSEGEEWKELNRNERRRLNLRYEESSGSTFELRRYFGGDRLGRDSTKGKVNLRDPIIRAPTECDEGLPNITE